MEDWGDKREGMAAYANHPFDKYRQELRERNQTRAAGRVEVKLSPKEHLGTHDFL